MNDPTHCIFLVSGSLQSAGGGVCFVSERARRHDSGGLGQLWVSFDEFTARTEEPWISEANRSAGAAALDILFGFKNGLSRFIRSSLQRVETFMLFWRFGAYLRRSTALYLAARGCDGLIFLWPSEGLFCEDGRTNTSHVLPTKAAQQIKCSVWAWCIVLLFTITDSVYGCCWLVFALC